MADKWYQSAYRRNLVDMHIADWDERFLSEFDPQAYVETVCRAGIDAAMVYAHSHVGHCYYPTQVGHQHASLRGRDIFGPVVEGFHRRGLDVIAYFSLIYDDYNYRKHADWRIVRATGEGASEHMRYGVCCPNSPYRDYAAAHVAELCSRYHFEGIFLDMTFWPAVCYCPHCAARYAAEVGGPLPTVINWEDPAWVSFQRKREEWLVEFAQHLTAAVRGAAPHVTVQHQASTYLLPWRFGVTDRLAAANDYLGGDFYGDALEGSVVRKLFANLSPSLPYEFMTSFCVDLRNHTARKPPELLEAKASACIADGAAFLFIDAIDPVGTINPATYDQMAGIFTRTQPYERFLGGVPVQDVAIYAGLEAKHDPADNGKEVEDPNLSTKMPHVAGILGAARALIENHIPYGVLTRAGLARLARYQLVILPDVLALSTEEAEALRAYVRGGGALYASRATSLITPDGVRHADFLLGDVFGVSYVGETRETFTYMAPADGAADLFGGYSAQWPLGLDGPQAIVAARAGSEILGWITLPYTDPAEPRRFASIHSNPPGIRTAYPALVANRYGAGQAIYATGALEGSDVARGLFTNLVRRLAAPFTATADAPKAVEMTILHQDGPQGGAGHRYIVSLVNFQKDLPNIPVEGVRVRFRTGGRRVASLCLLPDEQPWPYETSADEIEFEAPKLETLRMFRIEVE